MIKMQHVRTLKAHLLVLVTADTVEMERHVLVRKRECSSAYLLSFSQMYSSYLFTHILTIPPNYMSKPSVVNSFILLAVVTDHTHFGGH